MPTFEGSYRLSGIGSSGRVSFSNATVAYYVPLIDTAKVTIANNVTGDTSDYNVAARLSFPILFMLSATAACRIRQRILHPTCPVDTANVFARMTGSCGYSSVAAGTDKVLNATLPLANVGAGTTSLATRVFNASQDVSASGSNYGALLAASLYLPLMVSNIRECWLQIIAVDGTASATSGEFHFTCVSDNNIVGY